MRVSAEFDAASFVEKAVEELRRRIGDRRAIIAVSGGVDSTTCAALTYRAIGRNLVCVFIDTGFMRKGEPEEVYRRLTAPPLNLPLKLIRAKDRFFKALKGLSDAEQKRMAFRKTFYEVLSEEARKEGCTVLVQGTIAPDWIETLGGIKTQHNILEQLGVDTAREYGFDLVEPLVDLYKDQVRAVARYLGVPVEVSERQPFPGPGLSVRAVGEITEEKVEIAREASWIVEERLKEFKPSQYFAAVFEDERVDSDRHLKREIARMLKLSEDELQLYCFKARATGVKGDARAYGKIVGLECWRRLEGGVDVDLFDMAVKRLVHWDPEVTRVLCAVTERCHGKYAVAIRAVMTRDFMTAKVARLPWEVLMEVGKKILERCPAVSQVFYDVTSKPPATVEFE